MWSSSSAYYDDLHMSEELYVQHTTFLPRKGGSVAYRWQSSDLSLAATYCAQLFVKYRALGSILQFYA